MSYYTMRCSTENYNTQEWWKLTFEFEDIYLLLSYFARLSFLLCHYWVNNGIKYKAKYYTLYKFCKYATYVIVTQTFYADNLLWVYTIGDFCSSATSCTECFRLSVNCVWCAQPVSIY